MTTVTPVIEADLEYLPPMGRMTDALNYGLQPHDERRVTIPITFELKNGPVLTVHLKGIVLRSVGMCCVFGTVTRVKGTGQFRNWRFIAECNVFTRMGTIALHPDWEELKERLRLHSLNLD